MEEEHNSHRHRPTEGRIGGGGGGGQRISWNPPPPPFIFW